MSLATESRNNRILIIDDNPAIHEDLLKILLPVRKPNTGLAQTKSVLFEESEASVERDTFSIDSAFQGEEGLQMLQRALQAGDPYALAFVDVRMPPGWDGVETVTQLWKVYPDLQVVICTAYSDYPWEEMTARVGRSANMVLLKKPFDNIEVLQLAHAMTEKWRLNQQVRAQISSLDERVRKKTSELAKVNEHLMREIAEREQTEQALRQAQKMEAIGQLAAGIAHDFNNILTVILGHVSLLREFPESEDGEPDALLEIQNSADRGASLVRQLLAFSRKQVMRPLPMIVGDVLSSLGEVLRRVLGEQINLDVRCAENLPLIVADLCMLEQVIINLAVNSRDAMPRGGDLSIGADVVEFSSDVAERNPEARPGPFVRLEVSDSGCGIAADHLPRIFEPFFTTKATGEGTGLGLASVYGVLKQHDGWVEVESTPGAGTTFRLFWPAHLSGEKPQGDADASRSVPGGTETVLVVEDEQPVRRLIAGVLERNGYRVFESESGPDALEVFHRRAGEIDLLLTDMVLPGPFAGEDLSDMLRKEHPTLKVTYMTGYSPSIAGKGLGKGGEFQLLIKPFSTSDLLRTVRRCMDGAASEFDTVVK